ncbi:conserved hypothetical protein [Trichinella spiralis]|uniref:hypothetical protein n=1 Tax=Trichinella spiralis TaxID=6334 RepID=UPI0001EFEEE3|nr:conserved hypothetical protein [Trichinella spiralis]
MRCFTRLVRPRSASPRKMAFPHFQSMLRRALLLFAEHSAPSTRARVQSSGPSVPAPASGATLRGLATTAQPMLACRHGMGRARSSPSNRPSWLFPELASQLSERTSRRSSFPGRSEPPDFSPPSPAHVPSNGPVATAPPPLR